MARIGLKQLGKLKEIYYFLNSLRIGNLMIIEYLSWGGAIVEVKRPFPNHFRKILSLMNFY